MLDRVPLQGSSKLVVSFVKKQLLVLAKGSICLGSVFLLPGGLLELLRVLSMLALNSSSRSSGDGNRYA